MTLLPKVKLKAAVNFPASVLDGTGIDVAKSNGSYQFNLDFGDFAPPVAGLADPAHQNALLWNDSTGQYALVSALVIGSGGASPATALPLVESGAGAVGTALRYAREDHVHPASAGGGAVSSYNGQTGAVSAFSADKRIYVSTAGNDANNGLSPESAKLTIQAALTAASGGGIVTVGTGTFTLTTALLMTPGVWLVLSPGTIITQGNAANLAPMVNFTTNSAHGAAIVGGTIDGNRAGNTEGTGTLVAIGSANDARVERVSLINAPGRGVTVTTGLRPQVYNNIFTNINGFGVNVFPNVANTPTHGRFIGNNFNAPLGDHAFGIATSNGNIIAQNKIFASLIGGVSNPLRINTSGTTVSWVSGPDFTNVTPGMFLIMSAGAEFQITAKASSISLTVSTTPGTTSNVLGVIGTGDLIGIDGGSDNNILDNYLVNGITAGIIISNASGGQDSRRNKIHGNQLFLQGECSICISRAAGVFEVSETSIANNLVWDCASTGSTAGPSGAFRAGITIVGAALRTTIVGNTVVDDQGTKTLDYWLGLSGVTAQQCSVSANHSVGPTNFSDILGGALAPTLTGWGTGATATLAKSQGGSYYVRVTAGSASISANPIVQFNNAACGFNTLILSKCITISSGAMVTTLENTGNGIGVQSVTFLGTPTASAAYDFYVIG